MTEEEKSPISSNAVLAQPKMEDESTTGFGQNNEELVANAGMKGKNLKPFNRRKKKKKNEKWLRNDPIDYSKFSESWQGATDPFKKKFGFSKEDLDLVVDVKQLKKGRLSKEEINQKITLLLKKNAGDSSARLYAHNNFKLRSIIKFDIKLRDEKITAETLEADIRKIEMESLTWEDIQVLPDVSGGDKFQISCILEQNKVSLHELRKAIEGIGEYIQSAKLSEVDLTTYDCVDKDADDPFSEFIGSES